ncbi:MAG: S8 family serine peptidase [Dokdonella sp.]
MRKTLSSLPLLPLALALNSALAADVAPGLIAEAQQHARIDALIVFADQSRPLLAPMDAHADYRARRRALVDALRARAQTQQSGVREWLDARGVAYRPYWIANTIVAKLSASDLDGLAARSDIARVAANPRLTARLPRPGNTAPGPQVVESIAWGVTKIGAPTAWAAGYTGQGVVVAGEDTGYQWDHPALQPHYRGWDGSAADHNHNWHDSIHDSVGNDCGNDSPFPCDDFGHGTHTAGTFVGDDGATHQTGVAPGAKWIGCRNMDGGVGTPARYIECMQWMLAPTDLNDENPDPDLAPDVINNSWGCPTDEGCTVGDELEAAVDSVVAGGIFFAAAAANDGPDCSTITAPPAIYDASFVVGATDSGDRMAGFSSRGPVSGISLIRPDLSGPGVNITSSWARPPNTYQSDSGTSMATPHVVGTVALILSAAPALKGHPDQVAAILRATTVTDGVTDPSNTGCNGLTMSDWPNYQAGYGRLDAWAAVQAALSAADTLFVDGFDG